MRVLFVAPYVPSPIRVRTYQVLRHLAAAGHAITLVALEDGFTPPQVKAELESLCQAVHTIPLPKREAAQRCLLALPTPTPLWVAYCRSPRFWETVARLAATGNFEVAHVEHLRAAFVASALGKIPTVLDAVDCITALQRQMRDQPGALPARLIAAEEWVKTRRAEPRAYAPFSRIAVTSRYDADQLAQVGVATPITVIPNGVDLAYFSTATAPPPDPDTLIFSGKMSYRANDDAICYFVARILPKIRLRRPAVRLIIAGCDPSRDVRRFAEHDPAIEVTGYVDDLRPYFARAVAAVCPMRIGVGIQNKALEAMAMGKPVVSSPIAARAIQEATREGGLRIAVDEESMAESCLTLLENPEQAAQAGSAARRFVEQNHRWECVAEAFSSLYDTARQATPWE